VVNSQVSRPSAFELFRKLGNPTRISSVGSTQLLTTSSDLTNLVLSVNMAVCVAVIGKDVRLRSLSKGKRIR